MGFVIATRLTLATHAPRYGVNCLSSPADSSGCFVDQIRPTGGRFLVGGPIWGYRQLDFAISQGVQSARRNVAAARRPAQRVELQELLRLRHLLGYQRRAERQSGTSPTAASPGRRARSSSACPMLGEMDRRRFIHCAGALATLSAGCSTPTPPVLQLAPPGTGYRYLSATKARIPGIVEDLARRTFRFFWETTDAAHRARAGSLPEPVGVQHRRRRLRADRVPDRRRARLRHARRSAPAHASSRCASCATCRKGRKRSGVAGYKGFFYHFLEMPTACAPANASCRRSTPRCCCAARLHCQRVLRRQRRAETEIRAHRRGAVDTRRLALGADAPAVDRARLVARGRLPAVRLARLQRGDDPVPARARVTRHAPIDASAWSALDRRVPSAPWSTFNGQQGAAASRRCSATSTRTCWVDFRGIRDAFMRARGIDYFENAAAPTYAQRAYAILNPRGWNGYGADVWGLTACDGPADMLARYQRRAAALSQLRRRAAPGGSRHVRRRHDRADRGRRVDRLRARDRDAGDRGDGRALRRAHLFDVRLPRRLQPELPLRRDAASTARSIPGFGWVETDYLGIDQGPILAMIANSPTAIGVADDDAATRSCSAA